MNGVILFADDKLMDYNSKDGKPSLENKLFRTLAQSNPVLGVKERDQLESSIKSIGSFSAVILDWQFDNEDNLASDENDDDTSKLAQMPSRIEEKTFELLMNNEFYSLVYVYSSAKAEIEVKYGEKLKDKYKNRIEFRDKSNLSNTETEATNLVNAIKRWNDENKRIAIPISWSQSINRSVQAIFSQFNSIDPNWIKELYDTAKIDGVIPSVEVLSLFQNILSERIIQDEPLRIKIDEVADSNGVLSEPEHYAKLIRILYYGHSLAQDPIMTGDIFKLEDDKYGIIITPECDIRHIGEDDNYEVLCFSSKNYNKHEFRLNATIKHSPLIEKAQECGATFNSDTRGEFKRLLKDQINEAEDSIRIKAFTQTYPRKHILPCFEFTENSYSGIAVIDFRSSLELISKADLDIKNRLCKLNTPYIQELRQRYLSYKGRVGVPGYSMKLREWLLKNN